MKPTVSLKMDQDTGRIRATIEEGFDPRVPRTFRSVGGYDYHSPSKLWSWPATPKIAYDLIDQLQAIDGRIVMDSEVEDMAMRHHSQQMIHEVDNEQLPEIPYTDKTLPPWPHQLRGYHLAMEADAAGLYFDMGTGKTRCAIDVAQNMSKAELVLVVCPKSVIQVWPKEFAKWATDPQRWNVLPLNKRSVAKRAEQAREAIENREDGETVVCVINYESVWRSKFADLVLGNQWDLIIADEAHRIKSPKGKASKFFAKLPTVSGKRLALTGTPMPHSPLDVFGLYRFLEPGMFGRSFVRFRNRYAEMGGFEGKEVVGWMNESELREKIYSIAVRVEADDVLDLPDAIHSQVPVELSSKAMKIYQSLEDTLEAQVADGMVTANNALTKLIRLQQVTGGFAATSDESWLSMQMMSSEERSQIEYTLERVDTAKEDALSDLLSDMPHHEKVVVFCKFHGDLDAVMSAADRCTRPVFELSGRNNTLEEWEDSQNGAVLAVQIQAGGVGVDLTDANQCVYYSVGFSLGDYLQSLARCHRHGQDQVVHFHHLVATGTIDEKVYKSLDAKRDVVDSILNDLGVEKE